MPRTSRATEPADPPARNRRRPAADSPRRQEILGIAATVFAEQGYRGTTVRDIAEQAGMLSGSLFYHFKTKEQMAEELIRPVFEELVQITKSAMSEDEPTRDQIRSMGSRYLEVLGQHLLPMRLLYNDWPYLISLFPFLQEGFDTITKSWMRMIKRGVAAGEIRDDIDPVILFHIVRGVFNDVVRWYDPTGRRSMAEVADATVAIVLDGIARR